MFTSRRQLRRWAAQMLLVWVFGLAMGVANACALGQSGHYIGTANASATISSQHQDDDGHDAGQANCADFCGQSSMGALQLKVFDEFFFALGLAVSKSTTITVVEMPEPAVAQLVVDPPFLRGSPALRVAFQRLAL